ncbi:MAG: aminotransferase class I/II-fold pyridoxal phosphate-dependent enzyme, partial [Chitinivibrionales bacterium]|nr:aminotransferase class I/II-fold pyridoxal phosphate-dependent enzyme [Chitinivibrionales bacterium]
VWGFRVGFMTFGTKQNSPELYAALESKIAGQVRGNVSNTSNLAQALLLNAYSAQEYQDEKKQKFDILKRRYDKIKQIFRDHPEYAGFFEPLPFNSGYFMCIRPEVSDTEALRRLLLEKYGTGLVAVGSIIRVAFSSTPFDKLEQLFENVFSACKELDE